MKIEKFIIAILTLWSSELSLIAETTRLNEIEVISKTKEGYIIKDVKGIGIWGERSIQDTPYSISIIPDELIENTIAKDMDQIFKMNPTTQEQATIANESIDGAYVTIRGFEVSNSIINGIPSTNRIASTPMMQDIRRIEIINGATGFLYGGGRVGGAVNYITKKPTLHNQRALSFGSYGGENYYGHFDVSGQMDNKNIFGYRISAMSQDGETSRKEEKKQKALSIMFDFKPVDNFTTDLKYSYKNTTTTGANIFWRTLADANHKADEYHRANINKNQSFTPKWHTRDFESNKIENSSKWNINDSFALRTNLAYEGIQTVGADARIRFTKDGNVQKGSWLGAPSYREVEKLGANVYLDSSFKTASIEHTFTLGYGYSSSINKNINTALYPTKKFATYYTTADMTPQEFRNISKPLAWERGVHKDPLSKSAKVEYTNILFGDDILFNEQLSSLIGVNYSSTINTNYRKIKNAKYDASKWTPTLSLIYKPIKNLTTYITYIESLEEGEIVGDTYLNEDEILDPYISKQYEIGTKYSFNDGLMINSSLFRIEKANSYEINTLPLPTLSHDGKQVHQGFELAIIGKVTDNLTMITGGTLMNLSIEKATNKSLEGKKPTGAATKIAKIYTEYKIPYAKGLTLSAGAFYTGKKYIDSFNKYTSPSYTVFDTGLRYKTKIDKYPTSFNFNIQNITNKVYWSSVSALGDPRTFALSMKVEF